MVLSVVLYAALGVALLGLFVALRPLPGLRLSRRVHGGWLIIAALALALLVLVLPAPLQIVTAPTTRLDALVPRYEFSEFHEIAIAAPPVRVDSAVRAVTASEIRLFRLLTWIRRGGRDGPEDILNAPATMPLLDVATRTTFRWLADEPGRELVVGTLVIAPPGTSGLPASPEAFAGLSQPGFAKAAMNFGIQADGRGGTRLTTETRVHATDDGTRRRFAAYWRVILPGSALIRRSWLAAVRRRAEES